METFPFGKVIIALIVIMAIVAGVGLYLGSGENDLTTTPPATTTPTTTTPTTTENLENTLPLELNNFVAEAWLIYNEIVDISGEGFVILWDLSKGRYDDITEEQAGRFIVPLYNNLIDKENELEWLYPPNEEASQLKDSLLEQLDIARRFINQVGAAVIFHQQGDDTYYDWISGGAMKLYSIELLELEQKNNRGLINLQLQAEHELGK